MFHDDTSSKAQLDSLYFNPIRRVSAIADKVLQEIDINEVGLPSLKHVSFMCDGQVARGSRIACNQLGEMFGVDYVHIGQSVQELTKFSSNMLIDHAQAKTPNIVADVDDKISQKVISLENKYIIDLLDKVATTSGNVIYTNNFSRNDVNSAQAIINDLGLDAATVVCSSDIKNAVNNWTTLSPWETFAINAQSGKADFNAEVSNDINYLVHANLLGMNWISIPSKDAYKVIDSGTLYVMTTPDKLGQFTRRLDTPDDYSVATVNGVVRAISESFAAKVFNTLAVVKIKKI